MKNHQTAVATTAKVAAHLPAYAGPLGKFLKRQAEVKAAAAVEAQRQDTLRAMRANILDIVESPHLFTEAERKRTAASVIGCQCLAQLQRWFCNVYRVLKERESSLLLAFEDGTHTHIPVTA